MVSRERTTDGKRDGGPRQYVTPRRSYRTPTHTRGSSREACPMPLESLAGAARRTRDSTGASRRITPWGSARVGVGPPRLRHHFRGGANSRERRDSSV